MALILETGVGITGANSYSTFDSANTWALDRYGATLSISSEEGERLLRDAALFLEASYAYKWVGRKLLNAQGLSWPRAYAYYKDSCEEISGIPTQVVEAQLQIFYDFVQNGPIRPMRVESNNIRTTKAKIGPMEEGVTYRSGGSEEVYIVYPSINALLLPLFDSNAGNFKLS